MPQNVGACLGHSQQEIIDATLIDAEAAKGVPENPAHHRDA
jgi:hypothetical protein